MNGEERRAKLKERLGAAPEQLQASEPELAYPLTGGERIVVYRRKGE